MTPLLRSRLRRLLRAGYGSALWQTRPRTALMDRCIEVIGHQEEGNHHVEFQVCNHDGAAKRPQFPVTMGGAPHTPPDQPVSTVAREYTTSQGQDGNPRGRGPAGPADP